MRTIKDLDVGNKRVLVRCDFNVPLDSKGNILDDFRIQQTLPTIQYLIKNKAKIILMSHLGRPRGEIVESLRLDPVKNKLMEYLNVSITKTQDCVGSDIEKLIQKMLPGEILLLENLRFHKDEEDPPTGGDDNFSRELSRLGDIYVNDAFGASHRAHASVVGITKFLPSFAGFLLEKETEVLSRVLENPRRPLAAIIGGVKIETKIKVIERFFQKADNLLLGGEIANIILGVRGILIGKPAPKPQILEEIKKINLTSPKVHLPIDGIVSLANIERGLEEGYIRQAAPGQVRKEESLYDIGPETVKMFSKIIQEAKTIIWSGPLGFFENRNFEQGTKEIAQAIARNHSALKVAGGGDTDAALYKFNLRDKFDHVSTGGGAMLEFLAEEELPGLKVLE